MNLEELRAKLLTLHELHLAPEKLIDEYRSFDAPQRLLANHIISEWLLSNDESMRSDAILLIERFRIKSALANLEKVRDRFPLGMSPSDLHEREKVEQVIKGLWADIGNVVS